MITITRADGKAEYELLERFRRRSSETDADVSKTVTEILENVRFKGDEALRDYTLKFDGKLPEKFEVDKEEINKALKKADEKFIGALQKAAANIADFHSRQKQESHFNCSSDGVIMGQRVRALKRVGIYVPGGTAAYPSSVLMNAIPAKIAGVEEIIMVTPPGKDGKANPNILAAAAVAGVDKVFLVGGAQAVAALAYSTQTIPGVDKIVGPGNIYVATAKRMVFGLVDIDMIAGPSEILIIADETARPEFLAADLLSQAEHDPLAGAVLLTTDYTIAEKTREEIKKQAASLSRKNIISQSLKNYGAIIYCDHIEKAIELAEIFAPEHLELCLKNPLEHIGSIDNAGSVFLGHYTPESLGDYYAGPNHVLPTDGTARFFSPLSLDSFIKKSSFVFYTPQALQRDGEDVMTLARAEGLSAHAQSIEVRLRD